MFLIERNLCHKASRFIANVIDDGEAGNQLRAGAVIEDRVRRRGDDDQQRLIRAL